MASEQDHGRRTEYWDWIRGLSGALPTEATDRDVYPRADRKECRTTILEDYNPPSPMLNEDEYNN